MAFTFRDGKAVNNMVTIIQKLLLTTMLSKSHNSSAGRRDYWYGNVRTYDLPFKKYDEASNTDLLPRRSRW